MIQGATFCLMFSPLELTQDHVLQEARMLWFWVTNKVFWIINRVFGRMAQLLDCRALIWWSPEPEHITSTSSVSLVISARTKSYDTTALSSSADLYFPNHCVTLRYQTTLTILGSSILTGSDVRSTFMSAFLSRLHSRLLIERMTRKEHHELCVSWHCTMNATLWHIISFDVFRSDRSKSLHFLANLMCPSVVNIRPQMYNGRRCAVFFRCGISYWRSLTVASSNNEPELRFSRCNSSLQFLSDPCLIIAMLVECLTWTMVV